MLENEYIYLTAGNYQVTASYGGLYGYVVDIETGKDIAYLQGDDWDALTVELDNAPENMQAVILSQYAPD